MRVAIVTDTYLPQTNGVVVYLNDALKKLSSFAEVILFAPGGKELIIEEKDGIKIYWMPASEFPFYEGYRVGSLDYRKVSELLKKENPDIIHAHAPILIGLQAMFWGKLNNKPIIVTYHTHFPDYLPHLLNGKMPGIFLPIGNLTVKKLIKEVFKFANVVTAPTMELVQELQSYGLKNAVYLPNGIDFSKFNETEVKKDKGFQILYVGRVSFEKKLDILLKSFSLIEKEGIYLRVAGSGPQLPKIKELALELKLKNVEFSGFVKTQDLAAAYKTADVFVSASDSETFGLTFIEAMYFGLPVIGVDKLGPREIIDSTCGLLVPINNPNELAIAIEKIRNDIKFRKELSLGAKKRAMEFTIEKSVEATLKIYQMIKKGD